MKNLIKLLLVSLLVISSAVYSKPVQAQQEVNLYVSNTGVDTCHPKALAAPPK